LQLHDCNVYYGVLCLDMQFWTVQPTFMDQWNTLQPNWCVLHANTQMCGTLVNTDCIFNLCHRTQQV